jgi:hypothetical protein
MFRRYIGGNAARFRRLRGDKIRRPGSDGGPNRNRIEEHRDPDRRRSPGGAQTKPRIRVDLAVQSLLDTGIATSIVASVIPNARTTMVNLAATGFATILNAGKTTASSCSIGLPFGLAANFMYQTTDPSTNAPTGTANTPANIAAGQSFFFAVTPTQPMSQEIPLVFGCANTNRAPTIAGLNTFLLTAVTAPAPDLISISDTLSHDGNMVISGVNGSGVMVVATVNIGAAGMVTFTATDTPFGETPRNLPLTLGICQTDASGKCINPTAPGPASTVNVSNSQTLYFSLFATGKGTLLSYDPANTRLFFLATQGSTPLSESSTAIKMQTGQINTATTQ